MSFNSSSLLAVGDKKYYYNIPKQRALFLKQLKSHQRKTFLIGTIMAEDEPKIVAIFSCFGNRIKKEIFLNNRPLDSEENKYDYRRNPISCNGF